MINHQNLKLQIFKKEHIPQFMEFVFDSFVAGNPKYHEWVLNQQEFEQKTVKVINQFVESADYINKLRGTNTLFNTFIRVDGKLAVACFACELHRFMKLFAQGKIPQPTYAYFPSAILLQNPQFTAVVSLRHAVRKQFFGKGLMNLHTRLRMKGLIENNYKHGFGIMNNPVVIKYQAQRGSQFTPVQLQKDGKVVKIYLCKTIYSKMIGSKL